MRYKLLMVFNLERLIPPGRETSQPMNKHITMTEIRNSNSITSTKAGCMDCEPLKAVF